MAGLPTGATITDPSAPLFTIDGGLSFFLSLLSPYIGAVFLETWLYGIYCILFCICTYVLLSRRKPLHLLLFAFAAMMFSLASADIGYTYYLVFVKLMQGDLNFKLLYPKYVMFVTNGVLADTLLMYRCYVVWGRNNKIILIPCLHLVATAICGYLFEGASQNLFQHAPIYLSMTLSLNVALTMLTAARIWWLRRKTQALIGEGLSQRYSATLMILVESGVLYSAYMILDLAFQKDPIASTILDAGLIQVVGIMPTLIIVQVGLGHVFSDREDPLDRTHANKLGSRSFVGSIDNASGRRSPTIHDAPSFREAMRSHRSLSDSTTIGNGPNDPYTTYTRRASRSHRSGSVRSTRTGNGSGSRPFGYDNPNGSYSKKTLHESSNEAYAMPPTPHLHGKTSMSPVLVSSPLASPTSGTFGTLPTSPTATTPMMVHKQMMEMQMPAKPEASRSFSEWKLYHPHYTYQQAEVVSLAPSRASGDSMVYSPI